MNTIIKSIIDDITVLDNIPVEKLKKIRDSAKESYYTGKNSIITDELYDIIVNKIFALTGEEDEIGFCDSKVKTKLPYWLGSMNKVKNDTNDLNNWIKKYEPPYFITDKLDGVSALLIYDTDEVKLYTRGNGKYGFDISHLIKYLRLPTLNFIKKHYKSKLVLRGEIIMKESVFKDKWNTSFKNSRHMIAGIVNSKMINPNYLEDIDLVIYEIINHDSTSTSFKTQGEQILTCKKLGFNVVNIIHLDDMLTHENLTKLLLNRKASSNYQIDGIIITTGKEYIRNTDKNPSYAIAYKSSSVDEKHTSIVTMISWNVSKNKLLKPLIDIEPVCINGTNVKRVTGNNARYILQNGIGIGTKVTVILSGSIIPKIVEVDEPFCTDLSHFPKDVEWKWDDNEVDIIQVSETDDYYIKSLVNFFTVLEVPNLKKSTITKLYNEGYTSYASFFTMTADEITGISGIGKKKATQIVESIGNIKNNITIEKLIEASSTLDRGFGKSRLKQLFDNYPDIIKNFYDYEDDKLL